MARMKRFTNLVSLLISMFIVGVLLLISFALAPSKAQAVAQTEIDYSVTQTSTTIADLSTTSQVAPTSGDFTVEGWYKTSGFPSSSTAYPLWNLGGRILKAENGTFQIQRNKTGVSASWVDTGIVVPNSQWFHVAITHTSSTKVVRLVINGVSVWSETQSVAWESSSAPGFNVGNSTTGSATFWQGDFDQIRVWSNALTDAELTTAMHTYATSAVTGKTALVFYDFNDSDLTTSVEDITGNSKTLSVGSGANRAFNRTDVKTIDTASRSGKIIYIFTRTYLTSTGGWKAPTTNSSSYEYIAVAGGGGGGTNRGGGGGAGGYLDSSGGSNLTLTAGSTFSVKVGQGGQGAWGTTSGTFATNGQNTVIGPVGGSALKTLVGGGRGGTHTGASGTDANGASGGSGGGGSLCFHAVEPTGGAATSGQGNTGASLNNANVKCESYTSGQYAGQESRQTGGGGGSYTAGLFGDDRLTNPTSYSSFTSIPSGGSPTLSTITGLQRLLAGGGGGAAGKLLGELNATTFVTSHQGFGIIYADSYLDGGPGGSGAAPGQSGENADANTGSGGGGGGGADSGVTVMPLGGNGSAGIVYLVGTEVPNLSMVAGTGTGAAVNEIFANAPQVTVSGSSSATVTCTVDGGATISGCSETGAGTLTFDELKFTSGTVGTTYTLTFEASGYTSTTLSVTLLALPKTITTANSGATSASAITWVNGTIFANSADQDITLLANDVVSQLNARDTKLIATGNIVINNYAIEATSGTKSITLKGEQITVGARITTLGGNITFWLTGNPTSPTSNTTLTTGLYVGANVSSNGGNIVVGGGSDPTTSPAKANRAMHISGAIVSANKSSGTGGNISIRVRAIANDTSDGLDYSQTALWLQQAKLTSNGNGAITINAVGDKAGSATTKSAAIAINGISSSSEISTQNGDITIDASATTSPVDYGIILENPGSQTTPKIYSSGTGSINITTSAGTKTSTLNSARNNAGLHVSGATSYNSSIYTTSGSLTINATAGDVNSSKNSYGIYLEGSIYTLGSGNLNVTAQSGNSIARQTAGIYMASPNSNTPRLNTVNGTLTIDAQAGDVSEVSSSVTSLGLYSNGTFGSSGTGSVVVSRANAGDLSASSSTGSTSFYSFGWENQATFTLPTGSLTVTSANGGDITLNTNSQYGGRYSSGFKNNRSITISSSTFTVSSVTGGDVSGVGGSNSSYGFEQPDVNGGVVAYGNINITGTGGNVTNTNQSGVVNRSAGIYTASADIKINATGTGSISLSGTGGNISATGTAGSNLNYGFTASGAAVELTANAGDVTITGTSGSITSSANTAVSTSAGLNLYDLTTTTSTGALTLTGLSGAATISDGSAGSTFEGVKIFAAKIRATGAGGTVSITGTGVPTTTSGPYSTSGISNSGNSSLYLSEISTTTGALALIGYSGASNSTLATGYSQSGYTKVSSTTGAVSISGYAQTSTSSSSSGLCTGASFGSSLSQSTEVSSESGNISIYGRGCNNSATVTSFTTRGLSISPTLVKTTTATSGQGNISIKGDSGNGGPGTGITALGIIAFATDAPILININSVAGNIEIAGGIASQSGTVSKARAIETFVASVKSTGGGSVTINADGTQTTAGVSNSLAASNGLQLGSTASSKATAIDATNGTLTINATAGSSGYGIWVDSLANTPSHVSIGATAANTTINATSSGNNLATFGLTVNGPWTLGGSSATGNFTINTDTFHNYNSVSPYNLAETVIDTTGTFTLSPVASNFGNSFSQARTSNTTLILGLKPSSRLTGLTVGKSGVTKNIEFVSPLVMNSSSSALTVYGGSLTVGSGARVVANELGLDVTGSVSISATTNSINTIGLVSSQSTKSITIANTATWTPGTVSGIVGVYGVPTKLNVISAPSTGDVDTALGTFSIGFKDAYDIALTSSNSLYTQSVAVTATKASGNSSTLSGTVSPSSAAAPISFTDLAFNAPGAHTITFSATGYTSVTSSTITISAGPDNLASFSYASGTNTVAFGASALLPTWTNITTTGTKTYSTTSASSICTLNTSTGSITVVAPGDCVVTAVIATDGTYAQTTKTQTLVITKANQASLSISTTSVTYGQTLTLSASGGTGSGAITYALDGSQTNTCTLASGVVTPGNAGSTCYVIATRAGGTNYNDVSTSGTQITINKANQSTSVSVPTGVTIQFLQSPGLDLSALSISGGNGTGGYEFSTSTSNCSISSSVLTSTLTRTGTCTVVVKRSADTNYNISTGTNMTVTVTYADQSAISVTSAASGTWGTDISLTKSGGSGTGAVTWSKVSGSICSVSGTTLSSTGAGTCVIKVSISADSNYNAASSSDFTVTLGKKAQSSIAWAGSVPSSVDYLSTATLAITGGSGTGSVIYEPSVSSTCHVASNILTVGDAGSLCEIVVTKLADSNYFATDLTARTFTVNKINQANTLTFSNASTMVYGETLSLLAVGGSGDGAITYSVTSAGTTGCSISTNVLSVTGSGSCAITAIKAGSTNYNATITAAKPAMTIVVSKATQSLRFTSTVPSSPIAGGTYDVSAVATSGLSPAFTISSGNCSISSSTVSFTGSGNCVIQAAQTGDSQYSQASSITQTVVVGSRNQTLAFTTATNNITYKTYSDSAFVVEATSTESGASINYTLGSGTTNSACAVTSYGLVTINNVGLCQINVDSPSTLAYAAASTITKDIQVNADYANAPYIISSGSGNQAITVSFTRPTYNGGATITGYELVAIDQTTGSTATITESGCSATLTNDQATCTVRGLENGVYYKVKVAAINAAGVGEYSELTNSLMAATNPAAVQALSVAEDNSSLVISWQDPDSLGGGTFDSYRIFIKRSDEASYNASYFAVNSQTPRTYTAATQWPSGTALVNGVSYDVKMVTVTTANSEELTGNTAVVNKVPRTVPDPPVLATAITIDSNLVISWTVPTSDGGAAINAYSATFDGSSCTLTNPTDTFCVVPEPTSAGTYNYEVRAQNVAGLSTPATSSYVVQGAGYSNPGSQGGSSATSSTAPSVIALMWQPKVNHGHTDSTEQQPEIINEGSNPGIEQNAGEVPKGKADRLELSVVALWVSIACIIAWLAFLKNRKKVKEQSSIGAYQIN